MIRPLTLAALAAASTVATADEYQDTGRKLTASHQDSVVWISVISKTSMSVDGDAPAQIKAALSGQEKEEKSEATGTVLDSSGLIVTSLGALDKSSVVNGKTVSTPMGDIKLKASSEIKEVKVITADGSEIPGDLVLKDADLGLAFIKVRKDSEEAKGVEFKPIDLADSAPGKILDQCVGLGRMDESMNREPSVFSTEISGITTKPRTFYQVSTESLGCPVFLANGKLLGVTVIRSPKGEISGDNLKLSPVVLPAADVAKVAAQAKDAKPAKPEGEAKEK